ncbi:DNA repair protein [Acidianus sulfidivorans JP7]|uniref:DNA repair protein n=1 Tax=Acidianus sulfidivorans JP7 TaxID=619593 RepID=A0A2U9ILL9_9CREN|nr:DNA repair protein [Acidianus sulfidivorans]AWR96903.1 DNA repair protein [Acidianus sulfidivorans JP7]
MSEEVVKSLINNDEFIKKVADEVANKIIVRDIEIVKSSLLEMSKKIESLVDEHKLIWEKFEEEDRKFYKMLEEIKEENKKRDEKFEAMINSIKEENKKRDEKFEAMINSIKEENKKRDEKIEFIMKSIRRLEKQNDQILKTISNLTTSLEQEATEYLEYRLGKEFNAKIELYRLELNNKIEIDIYGEFKDYVILGEVKTRGGISALRQMERHVKILLKEKPEISNKKLILVIYAPVVTKELVDKCREKGIYLTNGYKDFSELKI